MTVDEYNSAVADYADNIYRFVLKHLKNIDAARDVVQDTFEKVWLKKENIDGQKVKSYLFTTAYNRLIDVVRKEKFQVGEENIDYVKHADPIKNMDLQSILNEALDQLPAIQKTVILLRDYEGYDYSEIGNITDLKESQVKVYIFRGRKKLKEILVSVEAVLEK
ncbi:RNA polymerase sigma factor [Putridiphycobacter roseus]|uniref:RNA polymerase sigma factor n=1 Tax=Putridiphycobacter roseus TaxID=2219161 RepID=A0A2W1NCM5_9FLAO|nr:RNA polymerase sigma factor [Putridiphycobacter roseus]PZE17125.1 RNA polymerase sigma factor [Putridiphycobacter roseus]